MKPRILVTIGDINGVGPEIILKTLKNNSVCSRFDLTIISPHSVLEYYNSKLGIGANIGSAKIVFPSIGKFKIQPGKLTESSGHISGLAIETAVELCMNRQYDAIVTAPISKKALNLGGFYFDGYTEMLTALSKSQSTAMVMAGRKLLMGFATTHPPLKKVSGMITKNLLLDKLGACYDSLQKDFGVSNPSIGMLSLNPHAGESGQIGDEEIKTIIPAMKAAKKKFKGIILSGPYPSDSYFANRIYLKHDLTIALYHDQGFIPFKMIEGLHGVNFTAGLPFVRTSPDHGTAFDIAGRGIASEASLIEAIKVADKIFRRRNQQ